MHVVIDHYVGVESDVDVTFVVERDIVPICQRNLTTGIIGAAPALYPISVMQQSSIDTAASALRTPSVTNNAILGLPMGPGDSVVSKYGPSFFTTIFRDSDG